MLKPPQSAELGASEAINTFRHAYKHFAIETSVALAAHELQAPYIDWCSCLCLSLSDEPTCSSFPNFLAPSTAARAQDNNFRVWAAYSATTYTLAYDDGHTASPCCGCWPAIHNLFGRQLNTGIHSLVVPAHVHAVRLSKRLGDSPKSTSEAVWPRRTYGGPPWRPEHLILGTLEQG